MNNYFGIDFGTTNSAVALIQDINGRRIGNPLTIGETKYKPVPSFVAINKMTGEILTGKEAKDSISNSTDYQIFPSIKRIIEENRRWSIAGREWTPVDIASELFKALKQKVNESNKTNLDSAVVAVPVDFSYAQRNCIRKAAYKAGIEISMFISEPTAAFYSQKNNLNKYNNVVVFDWGGGTLDIAILKIEGYTIYEMAKTGLNLAGNDIDRKIAEKICSQVARKNNLNYKFSDMNPNDQLALLVKCEEAKCNLADEDIVKILITKPLDKFGRINENLDYDYFSLLIEPEINYAIKCLKDSIYSSGMSEYDIDCIICEGGSSRLRPLQEKLSQLFDHTKLIFPQTAMWDIAIGASEICCNPGCYTLNKPIGIIDSTGSFYPLLRRGQRLPTKENTLKFGVVEDSKEARFIFTDSESKEKQSFTERFTVRLRGFDDEIIEVSYFVDSDMVFKIKIHSNRMPYGFYKVWTYTKLNLAYEMKLEV